MRKSPRRRAREVPAVASTRPVLGNKTGSRAFHDAVSISLFRRRRPDLGPIPVPPARVVATRGDLGASAFLLPGGDPGRRRGGWLTGATEDPRFVIGSAPPARVEVSAELLEGRSSWCLFDNGGPRPLLRLLPGMRGEVRIGVSRFDVEQILRDPSLRDRAGVATYAMPYGAHAHIECGPWTFELRRAHPGAGADVNAA